MTKRMLIDATHAEETRVVVLDGSRLEDFDVETSTKKQLKGNIYLAKVVRVEPSLQAAFVEYGGNRHGFLAFGEIHPDYYQIPVADRQRLLAMEAEDARREEEEEDREALAAGREETTGRHGGDPAADEHEVRGYDEAGQDATGYDEIEPGEIEPGEIEPGEIEPGEIEPGEIEPGEIEPGAIGDDGPDGQVNHGQPDADLPAGGQESGDDVADASALPTAVSIGSTASQSANADPGADRSAPDHAEPGQATPGRAQPARIASESVSGAFDEPSPPEDAEAFRVPAASAAAEPTEGAATPRLVATFTAPAAETLPDGADGVQINAGQVEAGQAMAMEISAPSADLDNLDGDSQPDLVGAIGSDAGSPEAATTGSVDRESVDRESAEDETDSDAMPDAPPPETVGGDTENGEEARERRIPPRFLRNYKIQEVIRRRQILLVQVVKEERGTKGAALTTYISLAGRYCVLMPNSPRGGGISRKITSATDRRRLKEVTAELQIPNGMGLIVRTAGANRPKPEIKRDCEYLMRLWDDIREHTMKSVAPALIYEEASLIKRAIRDVYSRDIDEILVDGEEGWKAARDFMRMLMPSHVKKVQLWRDTQPLFARQQVEDQLDAMLSPTVQLRSGGYLVINQTEALVAIDVNSGRSTRERGIEETAVRTNLEAVDEVARQLRLRDLAGLIVIDLIDMESRKNNASVERRLKEALKNDRARIQVGHISHFGLMEMSRQRLRPSLAETSFVTCPHCGGTGHVRGTESAAIHVLRDIEEEGAKRRAAEILVRVASPIAMYILNHKRARLGEIEARYAMHVTFAGDDTLIPPQVRIDRVRPQVISDLPPAITPDARIEPALPVGGGAEIDDEDLPDVDDDADVEAEAESDASETDEPRPGRPEPRRSEMRRPDTRRSASGRLEVSRPEARRPEVPRPEVGRSETGRLETGRLETGRLETGRSEMVRSDIGQPDAGGPPGETAEEGERRRRRRRRRRGGRREEAVQGAASPAVVPDDRGAAPQIMGGPDSAASDAVDLDEHIEGVPEHAELAVGGDVPDAVGADPGGPDAGDDAARGRRRGRRGGRRRRRDGSEAGVDAVAEPGAEQPDLPPLYTGPTPANPFGGQVFDIFDAIEQAEQMPGRPSDRQSPAPQPEAAPGPAQDPAPAPTQGSGLKPEPAVEAMEEPAEFLFGGVGPLAEPTGPITPVPQAVPGTLDASVAGARAEALVPAPVPAPVPANDAAPEPLVRPIVIGAEDDRPVEKKRGWWRR
jgi:ribonuclease E